jgi:hypothetical protein
VSDAQRHSVDWSGKQLKHKFIMDVG